MSIDLLRSSTVMSMRLLDLRDILISPELMAVVGAAEEALRRVVSGARTFMLLWRFSYVCS